MQSKKKTVFLYVCFLVAGLAIGLAASPLKAVEPLRDNLAPIYRNMGVTVSDTSQDVLAALRDRGLWPSPERKTPPARPQAATGREWIYTDASGAPILRVQRFATAAGGKTFRQSTPPVS